MKKYLISLTFVSTIFITLNSFANFTIVPVKLNINKDNKIATMTLKNDNDNVKAFQLVIEKRENRNGQEVYIESKDLIATPVMFTLAPNKSQLVRVALKNQLNYNKDQNGYRVSVKELPHRMRVAQTNSMVNFILQFNVPITISN